MKHGRGKTGRGAAYWSAVVATALTATTGSAPSALAQNVTVSVDEAQVVSLRGSTPSLKELVVELCEKSGVELLAFGAADRPVSVNYSGIQLPELLARLLRSENYMVGLRSSNDGTRIAWLRVMGENDSGPVGRTLAPTVDRGVRQAQKSPNASPGFIVNLFASASDPARRETALREAKEVLAGKSEERTAFMRADPDALARRIAGYPGARELMVDLRSGRYEYFINVRLGMLAQALDRELRSQVKKP